MVLKKKHRSNKEYLIKLSKINIPYQFKKSTIRPEKWREKLEFFNISGKFESKIILDQNFYLIDGYTSYKIAEQFGIKKVFVEFVE